MAEHSWPWVSTSGDRTVSAEMVRQAQADMSFIGVLGGLAPTKVDLTVSIAAGSAIIRGVTYTNDAALVLTPNAGTRKDYIVLRYTAANREIVLAVLEGTAGAFPTLTQTAAIWEIAVASIDNSTGAFTVADTRDAAGLCRTWLPTLHVVGTAGEPAFQNSWVNFSAGATQATFHRTSSGIVSIVGLVKSGVVGSTTPVFTLPIGFRPPQPRSFAVVSNGVFGNVYVTTDGKVSVITGSNAYVYLDGISFLAG